MLVLEIFAGTRSVSRAFEKRGHSTFTVDWDKTLPDIDLYDDVNNLTVERIRSLLGGGDPDVVWLSPDCSSYSVASIGHHRSKNKLTGNLDPKTEYAAFCDKTNAYIIDLIVNQLKPKLWFIENPRAGMRKMSFVKDLPRYTVTYCQWGDTRMKPTDIWTNHPNPQFKPPCHYGDPCHEKAPRGTKCGTQAIKGAKDRGRIPEQLCEHIVDISEQYL